jgi:nicotinate phosphoribosyltransferase
MSEVSEAYFENYLLSHNISPIDVYNEGDRRLSEKIKVLQDHPDIKIVDFGTRRRFSLKWHEHVLERLVDECPDSLVGTSNVALAQKYGLKPIGTFAHELPMVYAALADVRGQNVRRSHSQFLDDWYRCYGKDYSIALTDTFGTDFFFQDFTPRQANLWRGFRQDSGNPFSFGEQAIDFYRSIGIDPKTKLIVFSDNLNFKKIVELKEHFSGRINDMDGVGTNLTNDVGIPALNIVMKATRVEIPEGDAKTVKMSDDEGKQTGPPQLIDEYRHQYFRAA